MATVRPAATAVKSVGPYGAMPSIAYKRAPATAEKHGHHKTEKAEIHGEVYLGMKLEIRIVYILKD